MKDVFERHMRRSIVNRASIVTPWRNVARAFTLAEAVMSILIVSVMLVTALNTVGASRVGEFKIAERSRGLLLAQDLMAEILQQAYEDPDLAPGSFGLGGDEVGDGSRTLWEDVDDYDGWNASPPENKDGTLIPDTDGWQRSVIVEWVNPNNPDTAIGNNSGVKRITVIVDHSRRSSVTLRAYRTNLWQNPADLQGAGS